MFVTKGVQGHRCHENDLSEIITQVGANAGLHFIADHPSATATFDLD
jgi:hypothetical protein